MAEGDGCVGVGVRQLTRPSAPYAAGVEPTGPAAWPLGALALGVAVVGLLLSWTYVFSPLAYVAALVAVPLGMLARTDEGSRGMGTAAIAVAVLAAGVATVTLVWV